MTGLVLAVMLYTFGLGLGLLNGRLAPERAFGWMALPCLAPIIWYCYGFLKVEEREQDFGLLLSALGWALVAIALLVQQSAISRALANGGPGASLGDIMAQAGTPLLARLFSLLAFVCLIAGGVLSFHAWAREMRGDAA